MLVARIHERSLLSVYQLPYESMERQSGQKRRSMSILISKSDVDVVHQLSVSTVDHRCGQLISM